MGFKDLTLFNETMLTKLAWRLLHDDSSLFFRVFKARFFPQEPSLKLRIQSQHHMHGGVFLRGMMSSKMGHYGEWEMDSKLGFGEIIGFP